MADAAERCSKKLDDIIEKLGSQCDGLLADLREIRRYNQNTLLIIMVVWCLGIPAALFGSLIWVAHH